MSRSGISRKMATAVASRSSSVIIPATTTATAENETSSVGLAKRLCCAPPMRTLSLFGEDLSTLPASKESTARSSATRARTDLPTLSDRLTQSLISSGLVKGITPTSIRNESGAAIQASALWPLDGGAAG